MPNRQISSGISAALARFMKLHPLEQRGTAGIAAGVKAAESISFAYWHSRGFSRALFQPEWADTTPPPLPTPLAFATGLAKPFKYPRGVARMPGAVFGVAVRPGLLFRRSLAGAAFGGIDVTCQ